MKRIFAFTLAEVLITLGIIGIVAVMTIPAIINNSEKQSIVSKVKEAYSIMSQATGQIKNECGGTIKGCVTYPDALKTDTANASTNRVDIANLYKEKLK